MPVPTEEQKIRFLKKVYFGVTNNPKDDVNPFDNLEEFGLANVGLLRWGKNDSVRKRSKLRFAHNYHLVLKHYQVHLPIDEIYFQLEDSSTNDGVVKIWKDLAKFK